MVMQIRRVTWKQGTNFYVQPSPNPFPIHIRSICEIWKNIPIVKTSKDTSPIVSSRRVWKRDTSTMVSF